MRLGAMDLGCGGGAAACPRTVACASVEEGGGGVAVLDGGGAGGQHARVAIDPELIPILACPESKAPLWLFPASGGEAAFLFCAASRLRYRIEGDVPVLLIEEAERMDERAAAALVERARGLGLVGA